MRPYFFFSYARRDHQSGGPFVDQFFNDLRDELARIEPAAGPGELAYRDTERLRVGDDWEQQLSGMISASRTMVALYSPAYFASPYCGKEWTAFHGRMRRHQEVTGESVPALIPVLWEPPPDPLPPEVLRIQYAQHGMGEAYVGTGLRGLLRSDPHGPDYVRVVRVIAERVREAAARPIGDLHGLDLGSVRGCFPVPDAPRAGVVGGMVRLFVAAGRAPAEADGPDDGGPGGGWYGARARDWAPYHPPKQPSLVVRAQQVITRAGHSTTLEEVGPELVASLDRAREDNQVSVLLVDPWTAGREPYQQALRDFDARNHPVTAVLVPAGSSDPPEGPEHRSLWGQVREVFPRNWLHRSGPEPLFRVRVPGDRFESELLSTVTVAQNRLLDEDDADPAAARALFGLDPVRPATAGPTTAGPTIPGLTIPAWPPASAAGAPAAVAGPHEGDSE